MLQPLTRTIRLTVVPSGNAGVSSCGSSLLLPLLLLLLLLPLLLPFEAGARGRKNIWAGMRGGWEVNRALQYAFRPSMRVHLKRRAGELRRDGSVTFDVTMMCNGAVAAAAQAAACSCPAAKARA